MAVYRFDGFVFDTNSGEIRKGGACVRLRPQPSAVLECLIQHQGELVTRTELQRAVWQDGIYVHFEHGLNSCIKQVRAALSDRPAAPRYVQTIPRRGYRFIATFDATPAHVGDTHHNMLSDDGSGP
jgi:DNA-binding winged helix-turn-helix (wHTH) protein